MRSSPRSEPRLVADQRKGGLQAFVADVFLQFQGATDGVPVAAVARAFHLPGVPHHGVQDRHEDRPAEVVQGRHRADVADRPLPTPVHVRERLARRAPDDRFHDAFAAFGERIIVVLGIADRLLRAQRTGRHDNGFVEQFVLRGGRFEVAAKLLNHFLVCHCADLG
jgi:hypothetical protein